MNKKIVTMTTGLITSIVAMSCTAAPIKVSDDSIRELSSKPQIIAFESNSNGFNTKTFFYDNGEEVVAFDTQFTPELAKQALAFLRTKTQNPISYVVITHPNPDKFNGMSVFQKLGAKVIASQATVSNLKGVHDYKKYFFVNVAKMFTEETYPNLSNVNIVFEKDFQLNLLNGEVIQLHELSQPGVSTNQTVGFIPAMNSLFVGDLVHNKVHAWFEGGIINGKATPNLKGWIDDLQELQNTFKSVQPVVYGGRGEALNLNFAVNEQINYLQKVDSIVNQYISNLGSRKSEFQGPHSGEHYLTIQNLIEKAFPNYQYGYMIQYGIYGLVNSKL